MQYIDVHKVVDHAKLINFMQKFWRGAFSLLLLMAMTLLLQVLHSRRL